jgi:acyl carrier protein
LARSKIEEIMSEVQQSIEDRVKRIIGEYLNMNADSIQNDANIVVDLGADSLDEVDMLMNLEDDFDLVIDDNDAQKLKTVQNVVDYVTSKV